MKKLFPGILVCVVIALAALFIARYILIGSVTIAILIGILTGNLIKLPEGFGPGVKFSEKTLLSWAIALMGFRLNYTILAHLGLPAVAVILCGMVFTITFALFMGRLLGMERDLSLLVGIGNGICGSSAIAAAQGVIKTRDEHVGVSIGVINLLGTIGIFLLPMITLSLPDFSSEKAGLLIGNTLQAIGQVTAAGFSRGDVIGQTATIVKMGRILLITPMVLLLNFRKKGKRREEGKPEMPKVPGYILLFILFSLITSWGIMPSAANSFIKDVSEFLLITAMAGIGMKITFRELLTDGRKALLAGAFTFAGQILFSGTLIFILAKLFQWE